MPDGDYHVIAVPARQRDGWLDPAFLAAAARSAARVELATGAPTSRDLRLSEVVVR
jgi:hypothetical protein